jgi:hypothetical protein
VVRSVPFPVLWYLEPLLLIPGRLMTSRHANWGGICPKALREIHCALLCSVQAGCNRRENTSTSDPLAHWGRTVINFH